MARGHSGVTTRGGGCNLCQLVQSWRYIPGHTISRDRLGHRATLHRWLTCPWYCLGIGECAGLTGERTLPAEPGRLPTPGLEPLVLGAERKGSRY